MRNGDRLHTVGTGLSLSPPLLCFIYIAVPATIGTWLLGWWAVPVVAMIAGFMHCKPGIVTAACATSWLILLSVDALSGNIGRVGTVLAGVMGLPVPALIAATLILPALLAWSAASIGTVLLSSRTK